MFRTRLLLAEMYDVIVNSTIQPSSHAPVHFHQRMMTTAV